MHNILTSLWDWSIGNTNLPGYSLDIPILVSIPYWEWNHPKDKYRLSLVYARDGSTGNVLSFESLWRDVRKTSSGQQEELFVWKIPIEPTSNQTIRLCKVYMNEKGDVRCYQSNILSISDLVSCSSTQMRPP
jgi:hypothetical protein